jgi:hypothetical protein
MSSNPEIGPEVGDRIRFKVGGFAPEIDPVLAHKWFYGTIEIVTQHEDYHTYHVRFWNSKDKEDNMNLQLIEDSYDTIEVLSEDEFQAGLLLIS